MRVLYVNRHARPELEAELGLQRVDKATVLAESDFLSLHVPLNAETRHWLGRAELAAMKPGACSSTPRAVPWWIRPRWLEALAQGQPGGRGARCDGSRAAARRTARS